jgi:hypothetical protein
MVGIVEEISVRVGERGQPLSYTRAGRTSRVTAIYLKFPPRKEGKSRVR